MVTRMGGLRRKSRSKLRKNIREKGKLSVTKYLQEFNIGDKVYLKAEPSVHKGMYNLRYHGKSAVVIGKQGRCYIVQLKDDSKFKKFIVRPVHLKRS
ncbi:50S ribosomal protein L21e [Candidatus Woesearchaeota archaeon]|nr:50S ribosomal protein L21e [Candidatus Woesearchaeota archaeon]